MIIIVGESGARVHPAAFLLPQGTPPEAPLEDYLTSVGESERRTRLDFLRELPPPAEPTLEARKIERVW
ncbi:MAG: hypothetical protein ACOZE5_14165 [Verrucomicrobiota bacterium]